MEFGKIPIGFALALAQNPPALEKFGQMPQPQRDALLSKAHAAGSKQEMQDLVSSIVSPSM